MTTTLNNAEFSLAQKKLEEALRKCEAEMEAAAKQECERLAQAAARVLKNPRRDSRNLGEWSAKNGHDIRSYAVEAIGPAFDSGKEESISDLFLKNKSPDHVREIKRMVARTASRGGRVRNADIVTEDDIQTEASKIQVERALHRMDSNFRMC